MSDLLDEIDHNFAQFSKAWKDGLEKSIISLDTQFDRFRKNYRRITSLNAWREDIILQKISEEASLFFLEAQNDALVSHALARMGSWRSSLKALRSCIENVFYCLYYSDHPVEFRQWEEGSHRLQFSELLAYFSAHPDIKNIPDDLSALPTLKTEYGTLSKAVHGSAKIFRMTKGTDSTVLWNADMPSLGAWQTREIAVLSALNLFLLGFFQRHLQGTSYPGLRAAVSLTLPDKLLPKVQSGLGIHLPKV
ncbi:hypothetical protein [Corallococcus carmarthensis]|uniref:hypothetical protein n=1 Tax=Corallococcus carmarthensis TaxID=2316728 RepID=UPI0011C41B90|nr:hypothetical protein [Corallococcus carmarthensis]